jgi:DNA-binding transcriptional regulator YiaG
MPKKVRVFADLQKSLTTALAFEKGKAVDLRVSEVHPRPKPLRPLEIRDIRMSLHASQPVFAAFLNVSAKAVQSWEQGLRKPQSAALRLLTIAKKNPRVLLQSMK